MSQYSETEWESVLRQKGVLGPRQPSELEVQEAQLEAMVDEAVEKHLAGPSKDDMSLDDIEALLEDGIDEEEERLLEKLRRERLCALREAALNARFGRVTEISKSDWVREVNQAGKDVSVLVLVARAGHELCHLLEQHCRVLAGRFPAVKFCRGEAQLCIPNYPERNLPTLLLYRDGELLQQWVGPLEAAKDGKLTAPGLEWRLAQQGCLETELRADPCGASSAAREDGGSDEEDGSRRRLRDILARDMARCGAASQRDVEEERDSGGRARRLRQGDCHREYADD